MAKEVFFTVCVPLIGVNHTAVIAITTPDNEFNYCTELTDLMSADGPLFRSVKIGLTCRMCELRGIVCTHEPLVMPHWKSVGNQQKQEAIMAGNPELMGRETRGLMVSTRQFLYKPYLASFAARPTHSFAFEVPYAAIGIDPAAGGSNSAYAISTVTCVNGMYPILGMDACSVPNRNTCYETIFNHVKRLRQYKQYQRTYLVVFIESNLNWLDSNDLATRLENVDEFGPVHCARFNPKKNDNKFGVWTSHDDKQIYAQDLHRLLSDGQLCYATNYVGNADPKKVESTKKEFLAQLNRFHRHSEPSKDPLFGVNKIAFTGKGGESQCDDLVLSCQIAVTNLQRWKRTLDFQTMALRQGWAQ